MRVYTNPALRNLIAYAKLAAAIAIVFVVVSQAIRIWGNEPALQEIRNLTEQAQPE